MRAHKNNALHVTFSDLRVLEGLKGQWDWFRGRLITLRSLFRYDKTVDIVVFDTTLALSRAIGHPLPDWVIGTCTDQYVLVVDYGQWKDRGQGTFAALLIHEMVHMMIGATCMDTCPDWLNEGLAMYFSEQVLDMSKEEQLALAGGPRRDLGETDFYPWCMARTCLLMEEITARELVVRLQSGTAEELLESPMSQVMMQVNGTEGVST